MKTENLRRQDHQETLRSLHKYAVARLRGAAESEHFRFRIDLDVERGHLSVHMMLGPEGNDIDAGNVAVRTRAGRDGIALSVDLTCTFCDHFESLRWKLVAFSTLERIASAWHSRIHEKVFSQ